jgi:hypothetical protein
MARPRVGFVSIIPLLLAKFEILTAINMKIAGFWDVMLFSLTDKYQIFGGTYLPNCVASQSYIFHAPVHVSRDSSVQ